VDHLGVVSRADGTDMHPAFVGRGGEVAQNRLDAGNHFGVAARHQPVTVLQPPHAARHAHIGEANAVLLEAFGVADGVLVVAVRAVDHEVACLQ
jgi:hypothetical protein